MSYSANLHGDVPDNQREVANELIYLEAHFDSIKSGSDQARSAAKAYVAMAHDWIEMGLEERGEILLIKANKVFPGYLDHQIWEDAQDDHDFAVLVSGIRDHLSQILITVLKSKL